MTTMKASIGAQSENPMVYVFKLMRLRWVIFTSGFQRAKPVQKALTIGLWLLVLAVFVGSYLLSNYILEQLKFSTHNRERDRYNSIHRSNPGITCCSCFLINPDGQFQAVFTGFVSG